MAGLVRDALWDNALDLVNGDGFVEETDLTIIPWNRTTVADGQWLQDHAIGPLSARDVYLADEIQKNVDAIDSIKTTLVDYGMVAGSASGSSGAAVNLVNAGGVRTINYKAVGDNSESDWGEKPASIVPGSESEAGAPAFTLGYMTLGNASHDVDGAALPTNGRSCIIQGNCAKGNANQLLMLPDGVYYRSLTTTSPRTMSQYGLSYDSNNVSFAKLMTIPTNVGAGTYNITLDQNKGISFTVAEQGGAAIQTVNGAWFTTADNKLSFTGDFIQGRQYAITQAGFAEITTSQGGGGVAYNFTENSLLTVTAGADNVQDVTMTLATANDLTQGIYGVNKTVNGETTALSWTPLNIPVIQSSIIRADGEDNTLDLRYEATHFEAGTVAQGSTAAKLQLKLVTSGGICADANGLKIDVKGSSAFNPSAINTIYDLNIINDEGHHFINPFACVTAADANFNHQLLVNPEFILSGFNLSAKCEDQTHGQEIVTTGTLQAILNNFEKRIHELEDKLKDPVDIDEIRPIS